MKSKLKAIVMFTFVFVWMTSLTKAQNHQLILVINKIKNTSGKNISCGAYRPQDEFLNRAKVFIAKDVAANASSVTITFDLPFGDYAIAINHDLNGNGKLDKSFFGKPKEPYGFSNNYKPKMSAPSFSDCKFSFNKDKQVITIDLIE